MTFSWFNTFIWKGYKKSLTPEDMWDLSPENQSKNIIQNFNNVWIPTVNRKRELAAKKTPIGETITDINVMVVLLKMFWPQWLIMLVVKVITSFLAFVNPMVLDLLIGYMSPNNTEPQWRGYFYACLMLVSPVIQSTLNQHYEYYNYTLEMRIRACLISVIYKKVNSNTDYTKCLK